MADTARGLFMGNRGILHDDRGALSSARWRHKAWIICSLVWKDWHRDIMQPGAYTELFFLDEAVALAAGHRPCALCRRSEFNRFKEKAEFSGAVAELDSQLHSERAVPRRFEQRRHIFPVSELPDGAIVLTDAGPCLVHDKAWRPVSLSGYGSALRKPITGDALVLTPPTTLKALRAGYRPVMHPSLG